MVRPGRRGLFLRSRLPTMYVQLTTSVNGVYVLFMADDTNSTRFEMRASPAWLTKLDDWRRKEPDLPSRAEAIRRLVEKALDSE